MVVLVVWRESAELGWQIYDQEMHAGEQGALTACYDFCIDQTHTSSRSFDAYDINGPENCKGCGETGVARPLDGSSRGPILWIKFNHASIDSVPMELRQASYALWQSSSIPPSIQPAANTDRALAGVMALSATDEYK